MADMNVVLKCLQASVLALGLVTVACEDDDGGGGGGGGNRSCTALCEEAQDGSCTSITGDCTAFCAAIDNSQEAAGCTAEVETYRSCQNASANVCDDPGCGTEENDLSMCYTTYCAANLDDPDCMTLINSF